MKTKLMLVGGFLAAGKTTLLREIAERLTKQGRRVGLVTNDQASNLVDTTLLMRSGAGVREVSGRCFCCDFPEFMKAVEFLIAKGADVIVAEPVGSCADLSATIMQPLKDRYPQFDLAPLTVLVDPARMREAWGLVPGPTHPDALYIVREQMAEADRILLNKADTLSDAEREADLAALREHYPDTPVAAVSALRGDGIDAWLDEVGASADAGTRLLDIDYDRYAHGEAVLGWMNANIGLKGDRETDWWAFMDTLLKSLMEAFKSRRQAIGHVKAVLTFGPEDEIVGQFSDWTGPILLRGAKNARRSATTLLLNARVQTTPEELETIVVRVLNGTAVVPHVGVILLDHKTLMPGRPRPTHRYSEVVATEK